MLPYLKVTIPIKGHNRTDVLLLFMDEHNYGTC